ncbi:hypothetical protein [Streptomyces rochei]|uniref:hypothetical protein n=1 Tax=Streptomyces rochei TaxID=1928 RepID=UPI0033AD1171
MTEELCARPACAFVPMPKMNDAGALESSSFCSVACERFTIWATVLAGAEPCDETERQLLMMFHQGALLSLRRYPGEFDELPANAEQTAVNDGG